MTRVGFLINSSKEWVGGLNYIRGLIISINSLEKKTIIPVLFMGKKDSENKLLLAGLAEIVEVSALDKKSYQWYIWKIAKRITGSDFILEWFLRKYRIQVFSHSGLTGLITAKTINWIPDFQHMKLPDMFQKHELKARDAGYLRICIKSDRVVVSSNSALNDLKEFSPDSYLKGRVLQFVAQPNPALLDTDSLKSGEVITKYKINGRYFYLPNQFWKHKNHLVVLEALAILKKQNIDVLLVCSGLMNDYRNPEHVDALKRIVKESHLSVLMLGLIDYNDVILLMKNSLAVINPSYFEGWSTTVEECKIIDKRMILSGIPVHMEQNPLMSSYFEPSNSNELANLLKEDWLNTNSSFCNLKTSQELKAKLIYNTEAFGKRFEAIVNEVLIKI